MEKSLIIGKRIECIIGFILLLPPLLGVIAFVINLFTKDPGKFASLSNLCGNWALYVHGGGPFGGNVPAEVTPAAPIYLGLMAIAGVYLVKDSFKYFFTKFDK